MKLTLGMMNCTTKSHMARAALYCRYGIPGTVHVSKHKSEMNETGHVGPVRSIVLITIHAKSTALYPTKLVARSHPIRSSHNARMGGGGVEGVKLASDPSQSCVHQCHHDDRHENHEHDVVRQERKGVSVPLPPGAL
jgi:hypothetical protein